jgi:hypothetical protein
MSYTLEQAADKIARLYSSSAKRSSSSEMPSAELLDDEDDDDEEDAHLEGRVPPRPNR